MLTEVAARDLGKGLRFLRHARDLTLRDVATRAGLSAQYIQNVERGERVNASDETFEKLARGYEVPASLINDLLLKARVHSDLERHGLTAEQVAFVWKGVEMRLLEVGVNLRTDLAKVLTEMIG